MPKHSILIQYDDIDNIYVATVPEIDSCSAHGETIENAVAEIQIAIRLHAEFAREKSVLVAEPSFA